MRSVRFRLLVLLAIVTLIAVAPGAAAAGEDGDLEALEEYWLDAYEGANEGAVNRLGFSSAELAGPVGSRSILARKLLAKAAPDECFYGLGDPRNEYGATPNAPRARGR
jgi:hypothetical protein